MEGAAKEIAKQGYDTGTMFFKYFPAASGVHDLAARYFDIPETIYEPGPNESAAMTAGRWTAFVGMIFTPTPAGKAGGLRSGVTWGLTKVETFVLRRYTRKAVRAVDANLTIHLTARQIRAGARYPNLRQAYRGSAIDRMVRELVQNGWMNKRLVGAPNRGVDFTDRFTGAIWDMTTQQAWEVHKAKYGDALIHLLTDP